MSDPVCFEKRLVRWGDGTVDVHVDEVGFGEIARFAQQATANEYVDFANQEHAGGRVAQGRCGKGEPCDRDRIHDMRHFATMANPRKVVLCPAHEEERWAAARS